MQEGQDGFLHGWCWSADAPGARQLVQIGTASRVITTIVAARFRTDLRDHGIGDGYHGFTVSAARTLRDDPEAVIITAREASSGTVFGRIVRADAGFAAPLQRRLAAVAGRLARVDAHLGEVAGRRPSVRLQDGVRRLGAHLLAQGGAAQARHRVILDMAAAPAVSVIGWGAKWPEATAGLQAMAPSLNAAAAELLFIDAGAETMMALLPGQAPNLRYLNGRGASLAACMARAIRLARAERVVVLDELGDQAGLPLAVLAPGQEALVIGSEIAAMAGRLRPDTTGAIAEVRHDAAAGLCFAASRRVLAGLGGIDQAIGGWSGLAIVDLVLRALAQGVAVVACRAPWQAQTRSTLFADVEREAFGVFAARWGLPA